MGPSPLPVGGNGVGAQGFRGIVAPELSTTYPQGPGDVVHSVIHR